MKSYRKPLGVRARMNTVMPRFHKLIGRPTSFGTLDRSDIVTILSDEKWYGDGQPRWSNAPTAKMYLTKWRKALQRLNKRQFYRKFLDGPTVAAIIGGCEPGKRCASNGCYLCARAFQRWLIWATKLLFTKQAGDYEDIAFNFVFPAGQAPLMGLAQVPFDDISAHLLTAIERTNSVMFGVVAFDISNNDDAEKFAAGLYRILPENYWQVHLYGIVRTNNSDKVFDALNSLYPTDEKINTPVKRRAFDASNYATSYLFKPEAYRRVTYWSRAGRKDDWRTSGRSLKATEQVEYLLAAHCLGFSRRLTLINLHPVKLPPTSKRGLGIGLRITTQRKSEM